MRFSLREFLADAFFYAMGAGVAAVLGYMLYLGWEAEHPPQKVHWSQGPQDPEPTH